MQVAGGFDSAFSFSTQVFHYPADGFTVTHFICTFYLGDQGINAVHGGTTASTCDALVQVLSGRGGERAFLRSALGFQGSQLLRVPKLRPAHSRGSWDRLGGSSVEGGAHGQVLAREGGLVHLVGVHGVVRVHSVHEGEGGRRRGVDGEARAQRLARPVVREPSCRHGVSPLVVACTAVGVDVEHVHLSLCGQPPVQPAYESGQQRARVDGGPAFGDVARHLAVVVHVEGQCGLGGLAEVDL